MSKDGRAGGGTNINIEELLANNPELMEQMANTPAQQSTAPQSAAPIEETIIPASAPPTRFYGTNTSNQINQPDARYYQSFETPGTNDFYGSGTEITQPGTDYFHSFPMPGEDAGRAPRPTSTPIPIFDMNEYDDSEIFDGSVVGGEGGAGGYSGMAFEPVMNVAQGGPVYGGQGAMPIIDIGGEGMTYDPSIFADNAQRGPVNSAPVYGRQGITPAMPILDAAEEEEIAYYNPRFSNFNIGTM